MLPKLNVVKDPPMSTIKQKVRNTSDLLEYLSQGHKVKYLFFWGHKPNLSGSIGKSCLSQWYEANFDINEQPYKTAEHYMMAEKARLFGDEALLSSIINAKHPSEAKKLGRKVKGFDEETWQQERFSIVVRGNYAKFTQNSDLHAFLLNTGGRILVEASPKDKLWGIGLSQDDPRARKPKQWQGLNLLGFALMEVRDLVCASSHS